MLLYAGRAPQLSSTTAQKQELPTASREEFERFTMEKPIGQTASEDGLAHFAVQQPQDKRAQLTLGGEEKSKAGSGVLEDEEEVTSTSDVLESYLMISSCRATKRK